MLAVKSMKDIDQKEWDSCMLSSVGGAEHMNPFLSHEFLSILEESGSVSFQTGWQSCHVIAKNASTGALLGCCPVYIKSHSYGEYVFVSFSSEQRNMCIFCSKLAFGVLCA